jgi:ribosome-associated protein
MAAADDKQARHTVAFLVGEVLGITDWFLITSGGNPRQVKAIVDNIEEQLTVTGGPKPRQVEGLDTLDWVLMDFGSFVVRVFDDETRAFYDLERLWRDVPRLEAAS